MKLPYFVFLALLGGFVFLILFIADREKKAGEERRALSVYRIPNSALEDPSLKTHEYSRPIYIRTRTER
jgi:hypothetical protein